MSVLRLVAKTLVIAGAVSACHRQAAIDDHTAHMLNTPAADPVPSPSASTAAMVKLGVRRKLRSA